jgi:RNA polymerase sigma factor (sigma-70 family)
MGTRNCNSSEEVWGRTQSSWTKLYQQWTSTLIKPVVRKRLCKGNLHLQNDLEDAVQEVWIRIFKGLGSAHWTGIRTWLTRTADRTTLNYIRDHSSTANVRHLSGSESLIAHGADGYSQARHDELWSAVTKLPPVHRDALLLHVTGQAGDDMAIALGVSPATARKRLSRARTELRKSLSSAVKGRRMPGHRRG